MASYVNTDGFQDSKYFARSWALITRDEGWIKPILFLWLAGIIPIVGPLGVSGYILEYARLTAWGISASPKQSNVEIGTCIKCGWRAFLVSFVWYLVWGIACALVLLVPFVGPLIAQVLSVLAVVFGLIVRIAVLRATIYQSVSGGMQPGTVFKMAENDGGGLLRIMGIMLLGGAIITVVATVIMGFAIAPATIDIATRLQALGVDSSSVGTSNYNRQVFDLIVTWIVEIIPNVLLGGFIVSLLVNLLEMIVYTALGLWMRQYDVPAWGSPDDPLPATAAHVPNTQYPSYPTYPTYAQPPAGTDPNQVPYAYGNTDYGQQTHGDVGQTFTNPNNQGPYQQ